MARTIVGTAVVVTLIVLAGCAAPGDDVGASPSNAPDEFASESAPPTASAPPPLSNTKLPTLKPPSAPPSAPTDDLPTELIVGTVIAGGGGPCYGMETNDGQLYALYGDKGTVLTRGDVIRVKIKPLLLRIYCGPGQHAAIVSLEKLS